MIITKQYIEKEFIPNYIYYKELENKLSGEDEVKPVIFLDDIKSLGSLDDLEIIEVISILKDYDITVMGNDTLFEGELDNYYFCDEVKEFFPFENLSPREKIQMVDQYCLDRDIEIRNQLILYDLYRVNKIASRIAKKYGRDKDDIIGDAYLMLVEKANLYDQEEHSRFNADINLKILTELNRQILIEDKKMVPECFETLSEYSDIIEEFKISDDFILDEAREKIINVADQALTPEQKDIYFYLIGMFDGKTHTYKEAGEEFQMNWTRAIHLDKRANLIMRHPHYSEKLRPVNEDVKEFVYTKTKSRI